MNNKGFMIELIAILIIIGIFSLIGISIHKNIDFGAKQGIVIDKQYNAPRISYTNSNVNGSSINIPVTHPQSWSVKIKKDDKELWIDVSENEYNNLKIGDCYNCEE